MEINSKTIKSILADIDVKRETARINQERGMYYKFYVDSLKSHLEGMDLNQEIEEYDSDEFE